MTSVPTMAACAVPPYSAFDLGWTYGPITSDQHLTIRQYGNATRRAPETVPGYWLMPPAGVR